MAGELHEAAKQGDVAALAAAIARSRNVDIQLKETVMLGESIVAVPKPTALMLAAGEGHTECVKALLEAGAYVKLAAEDGGTALYYAAMLGHGGVVDILLKAGAKPAAKTKAGDMALHGALNFKHWAVARALVAAGAPLEAHDAIGLVPLQRTIQLWASAVKPREAGWTASIAKLMKKTPEELRAAEAEEARGAMVMIVTLLDAGAAIQGGGKYGKITPLHQAAEADSMELLELLIARGAELNAQDNAGCTPLAYAAQRPEAARRLVGAGADLDLADGSGRTPLIRAAERGAAEVVRVLAKAGADLDAATKEGETALVLAARAGDTAMCEVLMELGARDAADFVLAREREAPDFAEATSGSRRRSAKKAKRGAPDDAKASASAKATADKTSGSRRRSAKAGAGLGRGKAGKSGKAEKAGKVERGGVGPAERMLRDRKFLEAVEAGDARRARAMLAEGADPKAKTQDGKPAIWLAAEGGHRELVELLLEAGAKPGSQVDLAGPYGSTALHRAAMRGDAGIVQRLLDAGADVGKVTDDGDPLEDAWTPLMFAARAGDADCVRALIEAGAKPEAKSKLGWTALTVAAAGKHGAAVKVLMEAGAPDDAKAMSGPRRRLGGVAEDMLEVLEFAERVKTKAFRDAVDAVSKVCGSKPEKHDDFREGAIWDLAGKPGKKSGGAKRPQPLSVTEHRELERRLHAFVGEHQAAMRKRGAMLLYLSGFPEDRLALLPTVNARAAVACLGPAPQGMPRMLEFLVKLEKECAWELHGAGFATLMLRFPKALRSPEGLVKRLRQLRPDELGLVEDGEAGDAASAKELAAGLRGKGRVVRLWWD